MTRHPLSGLYLVRNYHPELDPYASIMDLQEEAALELTAKYTGYKFEGNYYRRRQQVENWLAAQAKEEGVLIENPQPLYFKLTERPIVSPAVICIEAERIPPHFLSFTFDDSFENCHAAETGQAKTPKLVHPEHGKVYNADNIRERISGCGMLEGLCSVTGLLRYIEVQVWTRRIPEFLPKTASVKEAFKPSS
jgi:hypothetical protein